MITPAQILANPAIWPQLIKENYGGNIKEVIAEIPYTSDVQAAKRFIEEVSKSAKNDWWCNHYLSKVNHWFFLNNSDIWPFFGDFAMMNIVKKIDWTKEVKYYKKQQLELLSCIQADILEKTAVALIERMRDRLFYVDLWSKITNSCKVRALIYWSNNEVSPKPSIEQLIKIARYEMSNKNEDSLLIIALLKILKIKYLSTDAHKQSAFLGKEVAVLREKRFSSDVDAFNEQIQNIELKELGAHGCLIKYLSRHFESNCCATHALNTLLEKCISDKEKNYQYLRNSYYCDATLWKNKGVVFCHKLPNHSCRGKSCSFMRDLKSSRFLYQEEKKSVNKKEYPSYQYQTLTDFIRNIGYELKLTDIGIKDFSIGQYSYKISAYVNRLVEMHPHMYCRCGARMNTKFMYAIKPNARISATVVQCMSNPNIQDNEQHDRSVYLNYCWKCEEIIDSRECRQPQVNGFYRCMYCGAADMKSELRCPNCGSTHIESNNDKSIKCLDCSHNGNQWLETRRVSEQLEHQRTATFEDELKRKLPGMPHISEVVVSVS